MPSEKSFSPLMARDPIVLDLYFAWHFLHLKRFSDYPTSPMRASVRNCSDYY